MSKNALIIGRFQPFHIGHLNLIKRYSQARFKIKVGIGSSQKSFEKKNPLTFKERKRLIELVFKENNIEKYKIFAIPDIKEDSNYVKHVLEIVGSFDTILTGNPKVLKLFRDYKYSLAWNIESFQETNRPGVKITASDIRKKWKKKPSKFGLTSASYNYLKSLDFTKRLNSPK